MNPENNQSCMETLESLMENTQSELLKVIRENKELKIRLAFLEEENKLLEFECHCRIWKLELKYKKCRKRLDGSHRKAGYYCPEHDRPVKYRISYCVVCKIEILNEHSNGGEKKRCDKHSAESIKECIKIQNKKRSVKLKRKKKRQEKQKLAKIEKSKMKKDTSKEPVRVWSIPEAARKNINCIPLKKLFERRVEICQL